MNREQRRANNRTNRNNNKIKNNHMKRDAENLVRIKSTLNKKIKHRLKELRQSDPCFNELKHVQINYFNISKLGLKYQSTLPTNKSVGMSYGDAVVKNTQLGQNQPPHYLCINVYFDEEQLTGEIFQMLLGLTSKVHNWEYSKDDDIYIDTLGVYVDRVDFEKEVDNNEQLE